MFFNLFILYDIFFCPLEPINPVVVSLTPLLLGAEQIPCDSSPEHGRVRIEEDGLRVYECLDDSQYALVGPASARCLPSGYLAVGSLPTCAGWNLNNE